MARVRVDGKQFAVGGQRFAFRGVTYGTFRPRGDGERFPELDRMKQDFVAMRDASFSVVRTYTTPPEDLLALAADWDLRVLAGAFWLDWRYLVGASRRAVRGVAHEARREVRRAARRLAGCEQVLGLVLGNEVPADVVRWTGTRTIASLLDELCEVVREEDPEALATYANYPTAEYVPLDSLDFLTFNVFLEAKEDFRAYLTRLHTLAGNRPLVLGEIGLDAGGTEDGERRQAEFLDWQLATAMERGVAGACVFSWTDEWWVGDAAVEGWHFGLTRADRSPRPALDVVAGRNRTELAELRHTWEPLSVVICAYNAAETLDECLVHACALDYPHLEILVVDDGSTDATAEIARRHPRARLLQIEHAGLSVARNEGFRAARGKIVAYLDSDAYPSPEWPYYLVLGFDRRTVGGVGGPNVPPLDDPLGAQVVARAPGGPVHVLLSDDRAEHVPGCNMAFWRHLLEEVGGFDPVYTSAGDDVDLCWKVLDRRWEIGFHPAALVWHHRRPGLRRYLRQQRGYGRAEALVEARHPDRFGPTGTARWRGRIYDSLVPSRGRARIYRGLYGTAAYQSVYRAGGYGIDLAHQLGVPVAVPLLLSAPLALVHPLLGVAPVLALVGLAVLAAADMARARPPRQLRDRRLGFRLRVAVHHLLQPLVRTWGRRRAGTLARRQLPPPTPLPGPASRAPGGTVLLPADGPRAGVAAAIVGALRRRGLRVSAPTGWEDHDARLTLSTLVAGDLLTSNHPPGTVQACVRPRLRLVRTAAALGAGLLLGLVAPLLAAAVQVLVWTDLGRGWWRARRGVPRMLQAAAGAHHGGQTS
ncbi:MAG TPA: glycosyltransferase family 2 protein [Acidimicrobiales bacterium]|nr:glycosyltransferase family 2 protein [Acidimicrobiales bacterium]